MQKLQSLTVLRAVAAATVVFFHVMTPTGHTFGEFGVDIFFVISGFVIALVTDNPALTARRFLADRIARLVPLYWLLTLGVFAGALAAPDLFNSTTANFGNLLKSLLFIPYRKESGQIFPMLFVGWTLNYEMLFYAVTAVSMALMRRRRLLLASALIFVIFCAAKASGSHGVMADFYSNQRVLEFPLGFLIYRLWNFGIRINPLLAGGMAASAYTWMAYVNWHGLSHAPLLYYGAPAFLLIVSSLSLESAMDAGLLTRTAIFVGNASYAIYLSHPYCVEAARKLLPNAIDDFHPAAPVGVAVIIVVATAMGGALYQFVDWPMYRRARRLLQSAPAVRSRESGMAGSNPTRLAVDEEPAGDVPANRDTA
ncbi:acyltransferase family protein [Paraburkholderia lycopersici]|uniref:Peptidoglycan/LPS O-acetylase OafA/YrhL, contains acyltransferase and SGNH-hydrolase domains n=1 Tax=Paraburkholderia lycopersici TaxID=416944 RepID=A0A1G6GKQ0_9BURK|nr:acyltransferase [Paraburkholderia lycopersici]SDB82423.1 Peptidoglycan/LPS O-acetylase OafA/YrhL, contains acyltransferase and SGNH-hydrolase domains [Paraburkholderia lycopersici]